jgi:hypothetical protein
MPEDKNKVIPQTFDLEGREIFAVGVHHGDKYTIEDLDEIADNFERLGELIKPPLKLGHNDEQEKEILRDGQPALGWIENVRRMGEKLVADFKQLPATVYAAIMSGRYKRISPEIVYKIKSGDTTFKNVLWAVSLLGADVPAVKNLLDIDKSVGSLLSADTRDSLEFESLRAYTLEVNEGVIEVRKQQKEDYMGELEIIQGEKKKLSDDLDVQKQENAKLEAEIKKYKDEEAERLKKEEITARTATVSDVKKFCEEQVEASKMTPDVRDKILTAIEDSKRAYSHEDRAVFIPFEILKTYAETIDKVFIEKDEKGSSHKKKDYASVKEEIHEKTLAIVSERKMDYADAMQEVLRDNSELAEASLGEEEGK